MQNSRLRNVRARRSACARPLPSLEHLEARIVLDARLLISEIVADNETGMVDEDGDRTDWIEIYNAGDQSADLQGWHLTDDPGATKKWSFPAINLGPREFLVVHASGKDRRDPSEQLHTNFQLNADGEYLALVQPDGKSIADQYAPEFPPQHENIAFGLSHRILATEFVVPGDAATWLVPSVVNGGDVLGTTWTAIDFDDSSWPVGTNNIGFETRTGYEDLFDTDVEELMFGKTASAYVRATFDVKSSDAVFSLTLSMKYDDGYVAYLNGVEVARRNSLEQSDWNSEADRTRRDSDAVVFEEVDITRYTGLLGSGENVLAIHALNTNPTSNDFLLVPRLTALETDEIRSLTRRYLAHTTPGAPNGDVTYTDVVSAVEIEGERGFHDSPLDVRMTTTTLGASIVYTTDGSVPAVGNGTVVPPADNQGTVDVTIRVDRTSTLRVASVKDDWLTSAVRTVTYVFADDVASQDAASAIEAGFSDDWGPRSDPDFGIDANVVGPDDLYGGRYTAQFVDSLKAVPTLSIVMDVDDLFDPERGIYYNSDQSGRLWERPVSVELLHPDGREGFQIDAGMRIVGGLSRTASRKKSFRLEFRGEYGPTKLRYPIFGEDAVDEFDSLVLRAGFNDSWVWTTESTHYLRDQWTRATQRSMGHPSAHGSRMHVYINGQYWGLYNPVERADAEFASAYLGGNPDEWDALKPDEPVEGTTDVWDELVQLASGVRGADQLESNQAILRMMGKNPDGTDNPELETILDFENYIDYMLLNFYTGNNDWPGKNYYIARRRGPESDGFKFFSWDAERSLNDQEGAHVNQDLTVVRTGLATIYDALRKNDEFRLMFADRVQRHFFNGGVFYVDPDNPAWDPDHPERNVPAASYAAMADEIELPLVAESARWGDTRRTEMAVTVEEWRMVLDDMFENFLPQRSGIVLNQLMQRGLYPETAAPLFNQHGGTLLAGFQLTIDAPSTVYYTLDGSDPRQSVLEPGAGASRISEQALQFEQPITLDGPTVVKARTYSDGQWSALTEATFTFAQPTLRIAEVMYHPRDPDDNEPLEDDDFEFIEFVNISETETIDLTGISLTRGVQFTFPDTSVAPGERIVVVRNQVAFEQRYGTDRRVAGQYGGTPDSPKLDNAGETLRLEDRFGGLIQEFSYEDDWIPATDGAGFSLTITNPTADVDQWNRAAGWRSSFAADGSPGSDDTADFDGNGQVDVADIDRFCVGKTNNDPQFDLTDDGAVDQDDLSHLVHDILGTTFGDSNLDGEFNAQDLAIVIEAGEYEDNLEGNSTWADGDWNCDGDFTSEDLVQAFSDTRFVAALAAARDVKTDSFSGRSTAEIKRVSAGNL